MNARAARIGASATALALVAAAVLLEQSWLAPVAVLIVVVAVPCLSGAGGPAGRDTRPEEHGKARDR